VHGHPAEPDEVGYEQEPNIAVDEPNLVEDESDQDDLAVGGEAESESNDPESGLLVNDGGDESDSGPEDEAQARGPDESDSSPKDEGQTTGCQAPGQGKISQ